MNLYEATATKILLESGYKNIAHLGGSQLLKMYSERKRGYQDAIRDFHNGSDKSIIFNDILTREEGYSTIKKAIDSGADAVFCAGDYSAFGAYEGLKEMVVDIGNEFGIYGFGNEPFAEMVDPSLSSIEQDGREMGMIAAKQMINAINGEQHNIEIVVPVRHIERQSSVRKAHKD